MRKGIRSAVLAACIAGSISGVSYADGLIQSVDWSHGQLEVQGQGVSNYTVHSLNGGYLEKIFIKDTKVPSRLGEIPGYGDVESVLVEQVGKDAHIDILLKNPEKIDVAPTASGLGISLSKSNTSVQKGSSASTTQSNAVTASTETQKTSNSENAAPTNDQVSDVANAMTSDYATEVLNVNFKSTDEGGEILIHYQGKQPNIESHRSTHALNITLPHTHIGQAISHEYNVRDFGTNVVDFESYELGHDGKIVVHTKAPFHYMVYDLNGIIRIIIGHPESSNGSSSIPEGPHLSMNFQNISVRDALQVISNFTKQNIVLSQSVTGNISLKLHDVPWKQAFDVILESQGLSYKKVGSIIWVAPAGQIQSEEEQYLKVEASKRKLEPLVTEIIPLKYIQASKVASLLEGFQKSPQANLQGAVLSKALGIPSSNIIGNNLLGSRGSVSVVTMNNSLLVRDTPEDIANIKRLIHTIDKPVPQVLIKAKVVQVNTNAAQALGIQWGGTYTSNGAGGVINLSGTGASGNTSSQGGLSNGVPALVNLPGYAPAGSALTGLNPASIGLALGTAAGNRILDLQLQALQARNEAKIISSPKVLTEDNQKATIEQGQEIPYQEATSSGATSVSFKKAELSLNVTPHIAPNGRVFMKVSITNNQPNYAQTTPTGVPINTQEVSTNLMVDNGKTVVIGGIYTVDRSVYNTGVPVLKDIPLLGWLFKSKTHNLSKSELLVFLTPIVTKNLY